MSPATIYELNDVKRFEQGDQWEWGFLWYDADGAIRDLSSGWTAEMIIANSQGSATVTSVDQAAGITLSDGSSGVNVAIIFAAAKTVLLTEKKMYYQLRLTRTSDTKPFRIFQGCVEVNLQTPSP